MLPAPPQSHPSRHSVRSLFAEVLCVLSELWHSKSGKRSDLHQVRVLDEERRTEVQGNDVDDESERTGTFGWRSSSCGRRSTTTAARCRDASSPRERSRRAGERAGSRVEHRRGCAERGCRTWGAESLEGDDRWCRSSRGGCSACAADAGGHGRFRGSAARLRRRRASTHGAASGRPRSDGDGNGQRACSSRWGDRWVRRASRSTPIRLSAGIESARRDGRARQQRAQPRLR